MDQTLPILFVDDAIAVVDKPSGLAVHRGWAAHEPAYAVDLLSAQVGRRAHPVHRLDRATSGVICFALDADAARNLGAQLEAGTVLKQYVALVRGRAPARLTIDHPLAREPGMDKRPAQTEIETLAVVVPSLLSREYSLVLASPLTGRAHQIRRHLKHISCPIIGDTNYGKGDQNRLWRDAYDLRRLALHALRLDLDHPRSSARQTFRAPLPQDLGDALTRAGFALDALDVIGRAR